MKVWVESRGSNPGLALELAGYGDGGGNGIPGGAVKLVDDEENTRGEGGFLELY